MTSDHAVHPRSGQPREDCATTVDDSIWRGPLGRSSVGLFTLAFLVAFEAFAVVTVMPVVTQDLGGLSAYALAFAVPIAVSILARTVAAPWTDAVGPAPALGWGVVLFASGLLVCGTAGSMTWFLVGRAIQGLGMGAVGVALYVWVARAYPSRLRPRALAVMTSAWTLPAVVGPPVAAGLAHLAGWRAVFLVAPILAAGSLAMTWTTVSRLGPPGRDRGADAPQVPVLAASWATVGVLAVAAAGQRAVSLWPLLLAVGLVALVLGVRSLVPARTWSGGPGLPSLMGARSLLAAAYVAAEASVPLALVEVRDVPVGLAGAALSGAAFTWFAGATLVSRPERLGGLLSTPGRRAAFAAGMIGVGVAAVPLVLVPPVPVALVVIVWSVGGLGMGAAMTTFVSEALERSAGREGATSGALQTSDAVADSTALALGAAVFASVVAHGVEHALLVAFAVPALCVVAGLAVLPRGFAR